MIRHAINETNKSIISQALDYNIQAKEDGHTKGYMEVNSAEGVETICHMLDEGEQEIWR